MSPGHPKAARSLLGRMLKGFAALLLLAWTLLIAREVYDVKLAQQRYARAENEQLARGLLLLLDALKDQPPARLAQALAAHHGTVSAAAQGLGISRNTVYRKKGLLPLPKNANQF